MSFTRLFVRTSALAVSMLFIQSAMAGSIVGYSGDSSTDHPVVGSTPVTTSAADARTTFLTNLGNNYYYEDFQEL